MSINSAAINDAAINADSGTSALMSLASPLGAVRLLAYNDFTEAIGETVTRYVVDLVTPDGLVRVPISSWQATLQTGSSNYVQCVIPAVTPLVDSITAATEFVISRVADLPDDSEFVYEMARAPKSDARFDRGPTRHTCTLAGYSTAFAAQEEADAVTDRPLTKIRSVSTNSGGSRIRCAIDWLLRPGRRALLDGSPITASFINYYVGQNDSFMDVGERLVV